MIRDEATRREKVSPSPLHLFLQLNDKMTSNFNDLFSCFPKLAMVELNISIETSWNAAVADAFKSSRFS